MLRRFCLYGFLKNQQYYEPFFILAYLQMGLNYTQIGLLVGFRALLINILEVPSGAIADIWGRRRVMILSFLAYILSFIVTGCAGLASIEGKLSLRFVLPALFLASICYAIGEAFRTGTHKAMIFTWLRLNGRTDEKTAVYGFTRSWSKIGSAVSVVLAALFVYFTDNYIYIFFLSIVPYLINVINFIGYPKELDAAHSKALRTGEVLIHLKESFSAVLGRGALRPLILESMGYEGFFKVAKDYLQPILKQAALPCVALLFSTVSMSTTQQSVILIGPVYFILFLLSALASRNADVLVKWLGDEERTAYFIWLWTLVVMFIMVPAIYFNKYIIVICAFISFHILQNFWRPVFISRIGHYSCEEQSATVLSIDSQAKSIAMVLLAPALGIMIDFVRSKGLGVGEFWPVAVVGLLIAGLFVMRYNLRKTENV